EYGVEKYRHASVDFGQISLFTSRSPENREHFYRADQRTLAIREPRGRRRRAVHLAAVERHDADRIAMILHVLSSLHECDLPFTSTVARSVAGQRANLCVHPRRNLRNVRR